MFRLCQVFRHGSNLTKNYVKSSCRTLYTLNSLGIDSYVKKREIVKQYYLTDGDAFREKMKSFVVTEGTSSTFIEVLKRMIHLVDPNEDDLQLLEGMLRQFHRQCKETKEPRCDNFIFGPVVMRCFHYINKSDVALKLFKDPEFDGFFDQLMSFHILCDMLYEQGRYQDVIDVNESIRSRKIPFETYPRHIVTLVFAACYKENTFESFKYCWKLFMELNADGRVLLRRAVAFAAALALKQDAPFVALKMVEAVQQRNYGIVQSIKVEALANLGRVDDAVAVLRGTMRVDDNATKCTIAKDSMDILKDAVNKTDDKGLKRHFHGLEQSLIENGRVDDKTLEDLLTRDIDSRPDRLRSSAASYDDNNNNNNNNRNYQSNRNQNSRKS